MENIPKKHRRIRLFFMTSISYGFSLTLFLFFSVCSLWLSCPVYSFSWGTLEFFFRPAVIPRIFIFWFYIFMPAGMIFGFLSLFFGPLDEKVDFSNLSKIHFGTFLHDSVRYGLRIAAAAFVLGLLSGLAGILIALWKSPGLRDCEFPIPWGIIPFQYLPDPDRIGRCLFPICSRGI